MHLALHWKTKLISICNWLVYFYFPNDLITLNNVEKSGYHLNIQVALYEQIAPSLSKDKTGNDAFIHCNIQIIIYVHGRNNVSIFNNGFVNTCGLVACMICAKSSIGILSLHLSCIVKRNALSTTYSFNGGLTHCGLVTPYDDIELGQHWFR